MTDREPFAKAEVYDDEYTLIICGEPVCHESALLVNLLDGEDGAILKVGHLNAAFEKDVAKREADAYAAGFRDGLERNGCMCPICVSHRAEIEKI